MVYKAEIHNEKSLQALAMQGLLKRAKSCKLEICEHRVIGKKTKVKFGASQFTAPIGFLVDS